MTSLLALVIAPLVALSPPPPPEAAATPPPPNKAFAAFVTGLKKDAKKRGFKKETLEIIDGLAPIARVIELQKRQPESTMTFARFLQIILTEERVNEGRRLYAEERALLEPVHAKYGVPPEILVSLWGIETKYGRIMGDYFVPAALGTLAFEGRRKGFFRKELLDALAIIDQGHIDAAGMKGSWAGAMGQPQFMPSTFLAYAADGNGDGRKDIWTTKADVFASAANYLSKIRWNKNERWGREVTVPEGFDAEIGLKKPRTLAEWKKLGIKDAAGGELPVDEAKVAWLVRPDHPAGTAVLAYPNFKVIMKWNRSQYFAASVGLLADRIAQDQKTPAQPESQPAKQP